MSDAIADEWARPEATQPPAMPPLRQAWPWMLFGFAFLAMIYFIALDQGALAVIPGFEVHEWLHDGRHLLGFPCH